VITSTVCKTNGWEAIRKHQYFEKEKEKIKANP
jgi:hypothetical protein